MGLFGLPSTKDLLQEDPTLVGLRGRIQFVTASPGDWITVTGRTYACNLSHPEIALSAELKRAFVEKACKIRHVGWVNNVGHVAVILRPGSGIKPESMIEELASCLTDILNEQLALTAAIRAANYQSMAMCKSVFA
jgi:hypothetical protein